MGSTFTWGVVTGVGPVQIVIEGDTSQQPFTPSSVINIDPHLLVVGDRVRCEHSNREVIIHGVKTS